MGQILDILGATIIGGFIFLMIANSNLRISAFSDELLVTTVTSFDAVETNEIIEFDFDKIGYSIDGKKIVTADSNQIKYYTDIISPSLPEGNGTKDSIKYYFENSTHISSSDNPNYYPLYRTENNSPRIQIGRISNFTLSYYDSLGSELSCSSLSLEANRNKIRSINILVEYQAAHALDSTYKSIVWEKTIRPRNLN